MEYRFCSGFFFFFWFFPALFRWDEGGQNLFMAGYYKRKARLIFYVFVKFDYWSTGTVSKNLTLRHFCHGSRVKVLRFALLFTNKTNLFSSYFW